MRLKLTDSRVLLCLVTMNTRELGLPTACISRNPLWDPCLAPGLEVSFPGCSTSCI